MEQINPQYGGISVSIEVGLLHDVSLVSQFSPRSSLTTTQAGRAVKERVSRVVNWECWSKTRAENMDGDYL